MAENKPEIEIQLTTETTEPGKAAILRNGMPLFKVDGAELELDYPALRQSLSAANHESQARRLTLEKIATSLGITADVSTEPGLLAVTARLEGYETEQTELTGLRSAKVAGQLDDTAEDKVKALAATMREKELGDLVVQLEESRTKAGHDATRADTAVKSLHDSQTVTALSAFYDKATGFVQGSLPTFLAVARQPQADGFRWRPTGNVSAEGIPQVALTNNEGMTVKGADGVANQTLAGWSDSSLKTGHPSLFKIPEGGPPGVTPDNGAAGTNQTAEVMSRADLDQVTRKLHAQTAPT